MQKIIVHNFGPLQDVEIEIKDFTVLIGEQASGKSTLAKLVYFFKSMSGDMIDEVVNFKFKKNNVDFSSLFFSIRERLEKKFSDYFGLLKSRGSFNIKYYLDEQNFIEITKRGGFAVESEINFVLLDFSNKFKLNLLKTLEKYYNKVVEEKTTRSVRLIEELRKDLNILFKDDNSPFFIPAGRNISVAYGDQIDKLFYGEIIKNILTQNLSGFHGKADLFLMQAFLEEVPRLKERFSNILKLSETNPLLSNKIDKISQILKGEYRLSSEIEGIQLDKIHIPFSEASTGQQESIRILQDLLVSTVEKSHSFKIIEEPEAHLFPNAQKNIIALMVNMIVESPNQVFITTHSPYILSYLNNLLFAWKVGQLQPEAENKIAIEFRLNPSNFGAYVLRDGYSQSIFDTTTSLIDRNYLDEIFEEIGFEYDALYDVYADFITSNGSY